MSLARQVPRRIIAVPRVVSPDRTYWGLRSPDLTTGPFEIARELDKKLPRAAFFTHTTAGRILGIPLPARLDYERRKHATVEAPDRVPHSRNIVGHGLKMRYGDVVEIDKVWLTGPERTWCDLGAFLTLPELVAAGDYLVHWQNPLTNPLRLAVAVEHLPNRRHVRILRTAIPFLSDRTDSPAESMVRVILAEGGFPPPVITRAISDAYGEFITHTDFLIEELGLLLHYGSATVGCAMDDPYAGMPQDDGYSRNPLVMNLDAEDLRHPDRLVDRIWNFVRTRRTFG
jgi:hypothetical protein